MHRLRTFSRQGLQAPTVGTNRGAKGQYQSAIGSYAHQNPTMPLPPASNGLTLPTQQVGGAVLTIACNAPNVRVPCPSDIVKCFQCTCTLPF